MYIYLIFNSFYIKAPMFVKRTPINIIDIFPHQPTGSFRRPRKMFNKNLALNSDCIPQNSQGGRYTLHNTH